MTMTYRVLASGCDKSLQIDHLESMCKTHGVTLEGVLQAGLEAFLSIPANVHLAIARAQAKAFSSNSRCAVVH